MANKRGGPALDNLGVTSVENLGVTILPVGVAFMPCHYCD